MPALALLLFLAADWLNQGMRVQSNERELSPATARKMTLLWARQLSDQPLSAPVILGRLITYRGTVELVFVASASGRVFAIDGDFGKTFWTRDLGSGSRCASPATPALTPDAPGHDEDDDGPQPLRPIYALSPAGELYSLHPIDGKDITTPLGRFGCAAFLSVENKRVHASKKAIIAPIQANGLRFEVTDALRVFNRQTNELLYTGDPVRSPSGLALANGHVCFSSGLGKLSCYGVPLEP